MFKRFLSLFFVLFFSIALFGGEADTLLLQSAEKCDIDGVKSALKKEANVNAKTDYHDTALALAVKCGSVEIVKLLLSKGGDVNTSNKWGDTPLHFAAMNGSLEIVKMLVDKKADIHKKNYLDYTALFYASINGNLDCVKYFIEEKGMDVDSKDKIGMTLLIRTCYQKKEQLEVVKYLVEKGANVNAKCQGKYRALHYAAMRGHDEIVEYLLKNNAIVNVRSFLGETPLDFAKRGKRSRCMILLKTYGGKEGSKQF